MSGQTRVFASGLLSSVLLAAGIVGGCSAVEHRPPESSEAEKRSAQAEIATYPKSLSGQRALTRDEARDHLSAVYTHVEPSAVDVCRHVDENTVCAWVVHYSEELAFNAVALDGNQVVVFHGIIAATESDDELAFILAHELGHHIADHLDEARGSRNAGMLAAAAAMAALGRSTGCSTTACLEGLQQASQASMQLGAEIGQRVFSVEQEEEADFLAAHILYRAGYDLDVAREMLLKIGTKSDKGESSFLSTHPSGPERLAGFDKTIALVREDGDGLPGEELLAQDGSQADGEADEASQAGEDADVPFDPEDCRIYLPEENLCIR
jgi:hypothetical protein